MSLSGFSKASFLGEIGQVFEVVGSEIGAYLDYTPPPRDSDGEPLTAPDGGQYRGSSKVAKYRLRVSDRLEVTELVLRVERGYRTLKAYEVVRGRVVAVGGKDPEDARRYYFWVVYEGAPQVRRVAPREPLQPSPSAPLSPGGTETEIQVEAGKTVVLDLVAAPVHEGNTVDAADRRRLRTVEVTLHDLPVVGASVRVAQEDGTWITTNGTARPRVFLTGQDGRVSVPCQDSDVIHVESPGGFSLGLPVGDTLTLQVPLGLPWSPYQYPEEVRLVPGYDANNWRPGLPQPALPSGWVNHGQRFLDALTSPTTTLTVSLGKSGRLLCRFNPPLTPVPDLPLLCITEAGPREGFRVRLGRALQMAVDLDPPGDEVRLAPEAPLIEVSQQEEQDGSPRAGNTRRIFFPRGRLLDAGAYPWVEIRDAGGDLAGQPAALPGLDITEVVGCRGTIDGLAVALDSSGSMTDNERNEFHRSGREQPAPAEDRLYRKAIEAILAPSGLLPPRDDHSIDLTFVGFYGNASKSDKDLADNVEVPVQSSDDRAAVRAAIHQFGEESDARGYTHYTPLAAALEAGAGALNALPDTRTRRVMIVITDGQGTHLESDGVLQRLEDTTAQSIDPGTVAVLELIGFRVPQAERRSLLKFQRANWSVAPHDIGSSDELLHLLGHLRIKYGL